MFTCPAATVSTTGKSFENSLCYVMGCQSHGLPTGELVNQAGLSVNSIPRTRSLVRGEQVTKARPIWIFLGTQYRYCERTYLLQRSHELKMITWSIWWASLPLWGESMPAQDTDPKSRDLGRGGKRVPDGTAWASAPATS